MPILALIEFIAPFITNGLKIYSDATALIAAGSATVQDLEALFSKHGASNGEVKTILGTMRPMDASELARIHTDLEHQ